jgi:hypothetical protein
MSAHFRAIARSILTSRLRRLVRRLRPGLVGVLLCAVPTAAQAQSGSEATPTSIATLTGKNPVRAWNGVQVWTDYGSAVGRWHVVVRSAGQVSIPSAIPAGDERLAADVGPGPDGKPTLAFVNCTDACRVVVSALDGTGAQTVPGSEGASAPTIWGTRVAWARGDTVLTRDVTRGRLTRLPGVPRRKCYEPDGRRRCERPGNRSVRSIELNGSRLSLIVSYGLSQGGGNGQTEVRMESVRGGRSRLVALMNIGEGGQAFVGPSWARGRLFFYKSCPCGRAQGVYRFDPRGGYARAAGGRPLAGFAMDDDGRRAFEALDPSPDIGDRDDTFDATPLQLTGPLTFAPTRPPIATPGA